MVDAAGIRGGQAVEILAGNVSSGCLGNRLAEYVRQHLPIWILPTETKGEKGVKSIAGRVPRAPGSGVVDH